MNRYSKIPSFLSSNIEAFIWISFLFILFFISGEQQFSLCLFKLMGFNRCPGCGLGHSIHYVLHFQFEKSIQEHYLGIPATMLIAFRIINIFITNQNQKLTNGPNVYDVTGVTT
ncbi:MAG TPA: DUF2752 domain-containing protein [Flavisolibacter sp.]|nr:DUF2752 domain-containing protein [Flavisolibacter sp.]